MRTTASRAVVCLTALVCICAGSVLSPAFGQDFHALPYAEGFVAPQGTPADAVASKLAYVVDRAATLVSDEGKTLLPAGTVFDRLEWDGNIGCVYLTVPVEAGSAWIDVNRAMILADLVRSAVQIDGMAEGNRVLLRLGLESAYRLLQSYLPPPPEPAPEEPFVEPDGPGRSVPWSEVSDGQPVAQPMALAGPVTNAGIQPTGALSGVTVFASCGHGWIFSTSGNYWYLERGLIESMIEDYGNIDQLNYFVAYLFNAGATVVPFRPVGYQTRQIVLDNDDPGVTYAGTWNNNTTASQYYENNVTASGVRYRWASSSTSETATARYTPTIPATDFYPVYCFTVDGDDRVRQTYRITHSGGTSSVVVDHRLVGKGWIWLGNYYLTAGTGNYVEITNASPDSGVVIADGIRFGNGMGDVLRGTPSPGVTSGFPREEECMRYWAESELGNNAIGFDSGIWDISGSSDAGDNIGTGARWGSEMNRQTYNNNRWRRVYLEFHSNSTPAARGEVSLITDWGPTTYQTQFATTLGEGFEADMVALDGQFEYTWSPRLYNTYTNSYGAISTYNNNNEFDATIIEVAFHDNFYDARLLRDGKVRNAMARASLHGLIKFLNSGIPGSTVPLVYLPDPPERVQAVTNTNGTVSLSWTVPPTGGASGHAATGYKIYRSSNGYGFDAGLNVGNVLTYTFSDIPYGQTTYFRVAAYNAGGESMPSETLAVRRPPTGRSAMLIVNGFDRVTRLQNVIQTIPAGSFERQILHRTNAFDYTVRHAEAMAANNATFDSCSRKAVDDGTVNLAAYQAIVWIMGENSNDGNRTFSSTEQSLLTTYLTGGGRMFVSGTDITYDLINQGGGSTFCQTFLKANYAANDANTYNVTGAGGILADVGSFSFTAPTFDPRYYPYNPTDGSAYDADAPDRITALSGGLGILTYVGGTGGTAAVQYDAGTFRTVTFAFPFETITSNTARINVMGRIINFLLAEPTIRSDFDLDGDVDLDDYALLQKCFNGDGPILTGCSQQDLTFDNKVNQDDRTEFEQCLTGPEVQPGC